MSVLGNVFTHYNYLLAKVDVTSEGSSLEVRVRTPDRSADLHVVADLSAGHATLPPQSPFRSMDDARTFAGPLPFTFGYEASTRRMVVVKGLRRAWDPRPVRVTVHEATYLERAPFASASPRLANAFYLEQVPYAWKPGEIEAIA
jgi:hypothetical protein